MTRARRYDDLITAYRNACRRAGLDPAEGPRTHYEVANAQAEARKAEMRRRSGWWWFVDWGDPGYCVSIVEFVALVHVLRDAIAMQYRELYCDDPPEADLDLRVLHAMRGQPVTFDQLERGTENERPGAAPARP